jgi:hypothetical protein
MTSLALAPEQLNRPGHPHAQQRKHPKVTIAALHALGRIASAIALHSSLMAETYVLGPQILQPSTHGRHGTRWEGTLVTSGNLSPGSTGCGPESKPGRPPPQEQGTTAGRRADKFNSRSNRECTRIGFLLSPEVVKKAGTTDLLSLENLHL